MQKSCCVSSARCSLLSSPTHRKGKSGKLAASIRIDLLGTLSWMVSRPSSATDLAGADPNGSRVTCPLKVLLLVANLCVGRGTLKLYLMMLNTHDLVYGLVLIKGFQRRLTPVQHADIPCTASKRAPHPLHNELEMTLSYSPCQEVTYSGASILSIL